MRSYLESFLFEQGFGESFPNRPPAGFQGTICCREKEFLRGATEEDACLHRALAQVFGRHPSSGTLQPVWRTYCRGTWDTYLRNHGRSVHTSKQLLWHASFNPISHRFGGFLPGKLGFSQVLLNFNQFHASPRVAQWLRSGSVAHRRWTRPESFSLASAMGQRRSWSWPAPGWGFEMAIGKVQWKSTMYI